MRGDEPGGYVPQPAMYEYRQPSVFARYKLLTIIFGGAILVLLLYWFMVVRKMPVTPYIKGVTDQVYIQDLSSAQPAQPPQR